MAIQQVEQIADGVRRAGVESFGDTVDRDAHRRLPRQGQLDDDPGSVVGYRKRRQHRIEVDRGRLFAQPEVGHDDVVLSLLKEVSKSSCTNVGESDDEHDRPGHLVE